METICKECKGSLRWVMSFDIDDYEKDIYQCNDCKNIYPKTVFNPSD